MEEEKMDFQCECGNSQFYLIFPDGVECTACGLIVEDITWGSPKFMFEFIPE